MSWSTVLRISFLLFLFSFCLYRYIDKQNQLTNLQIRIPQLEKKLSIYHEENRRLSYEIEQFESPSHLIELSRSIEYSHLQHPFVEDVLSVQEGVALKDHKNNEQLEGLYHPFSYEIGAK